MDPACDVDVPPVRRRTRNLTWSAWAVAALTLLVLHLQPISTGLIRASELAALAGVALLPLWAWRRRRAARVAFATLAIVVASTPLWPSRAHATERLRTAYLAALRDFEGTRYVWGGEGWTGIDCSGLVRRAMVDTLRDEGAATASPATLRDAALLWWHDRSAKALGEGFRGDTRRVGEAASLNALDHSRLRRGDLAVTRDTKHVLVYAGDRIWIAADWPVVDRWEIPELDNQWFGVPVRIMRWRWLD